MYKNSLNQKDLLRATSTESDSVIGLQVL